MLLFCKYCFTVSRRRTMSNNSRIASFAVFDLETTGLPSFNFNKANITEICINGLSLDSIRKSVHSLMPRVCHKLTLVFNPKMIISPYAETVTGLDNYMLEEESCFNKNAAEAILKFLQHLRQPVCLIAHNGNNFDFPILKKAFEKLGMELPDDILCLDSLGAFKEIDKVAVSEQNLSNLGDGEFVPLCSEKTSDEKSIDFQKINETTPKRPPVLVNRKRTRVDNDNRLPPAQIKSRRTLFPSNEPKLPKRRYNLGGMYERIFGKSPEVSHHAEADVIMLVKVIAHYGSLFIEYAELNAKPFGVNKAVCVR